MTLFDSGTIITTLGIILVWAVIVVVGILYSKLKYYEYQANSRQETIVELKKKIDEAEQNLRNCDAKVALSKKYLKDIQAYYKKKIPFVITGKEPKDGEIFNIEPR